VSSYTFTVVLTDPATSEISPLSLHDALPICGIGAMIRHGLNLAGVRILGNHFPYATFIINISGSLMMGIVAGYFAFKGDAPQHRSEEHTSELQSRENLVCRLLLEKKKIK